MSKAEDSNASNSRRLSGTALGFGLLSIVTLVALLLRLYRLGNQSLWVDEAMSVVFSARSLSELLPLLATEDVHPPLYPVLLHYWMTFAGNGEVAVRFPSLMFGVALVPLIYIVGRRIERMADPVAWLPVSLVGLVGALMAAGSTFYIAYSQLARNYMAATFFGLLSSYLLLEALSGPRRKNWLAYGVAAAAALYTHYTAFLLLPFHLLYVALTRKSYGQAWRGWVAAVAAVGLVYLPWLGYSAQQMERISDYWPGTLQLDAALRTTLLLFVAGGGAGQHPALLPLALSAGLLGAGLLALVVGAFRQRSFRHILFLLLYLAVPTALLLAVAYYRPKFDPRYLLLVTPAFYLTLAWGIASLLRAALSWRGPTVVRSALMGVGVAAMAGTFAVSAQYGEPAKLMHVGDGNAGVQEYGDYRGLVAYLESRSQPGDAVVLMMNAYHPYLYYSKLQIPWYPMEPFDDFDGAIIRLNRLVDQGYHRLWFILWQTRWADPTDYVMHIMETQSKEVALEASFGGIGLRLFDLTPGSRFSYYPRIDQKTEALFGGKALEFSSWSVSAAEVAAGGEVQFDLHWIPLKKVDGKLKTKLMLVDEDRHLWAVADEAMVSPLYPPARWKEDEILHDRHRLVVPAGVPPGDYEVWLILYDEDNMRELPIERWSGESQGSVLSLGRLAVAPTPESAFPSAHQPPLAAWDLGRDRIELVRSRISRTSPRSDDMVELELLWRAAAAPSRAYTLRVALLDEDGLAVAEQSLALAPRYPTGRWRAGEPVLSRHWLTEWTSASPGEYIVAVTVDEGRKEPLRAGRYVHVSALNIQGPDEPRSPGEDRVDPLP